MINPCPSERSTRSLQEQSSLFFWGESGEALQHNEALIQTKLEAILYNKPTSFKYNTFNCKSVNRVTDIRSNNGKIRRKLTAGTNLKTSSLLRPRKISNAIKSHGSHLSCIWSLFAWESIYWKQTFFFFHVNKIV